MNVAGRTLTAAEMRTALTCPDDMPIVVVVDEIAVDVNRIDVGASFVEMHIETPVTDEELALDLLRRYLAGSIKAADLKREARELLED